MSQANSSLFKLLLKLAMLIIFLALLVALFLNNKSYYVPIVNGYTNKQSYFQKDTAEFFILFTNINRKAQLVIYDVNEHPVDSVVCRADTFFVRSKVVWRQGMGYQLAFKYPCNRLRPGVYLLEKQIPLIIKSKEIPEITVVIPLINYHALNATGGKSFYSYNSSDKKFADTLSLKRPMALDNYSRLLLPLLNKLYGNKVNYIVESDIESPELIDRSRLIIFYGNLQFISEKMRLNIDRFVDRGGNMLVLTEIFMNSKLVYDDNKQLISVNSNEKLQGWNRGNSHSPNYTTTGNSIELNGNIVYPPNPFDGYKITDNTFASWTNKHVGDTIVFNSSSYSSPPLKYINSKLEIDSDVFKSHEKKILAYGMGIRDGNSVVGCAFYFRKTKKSGKVINLGTFKVLQKSTGELNDVFATNIINYLLN